MPEKAGKKILAAALVLQTKTLLIFEQKPIIKNHIFAEWNDTFVRWRIYRDLNRKEEPLLGYWQESKYGEISFAVPMKISENLIVCIYSVRVALQNKNYLNFLRFVVAVLGISKRIRLRG